MKQILFLCALFCTTALFAKEPQRPTSYNYQRGVEAVNNHNDEEGEQFLLQELSENPNNGYAYAWLAGIELRRDETGSAISIDERSVVVSSTLLLTSWISSFVRVRLIFIFSFSFKM